MAKPIFDFLFSYFLIFLFFLFFICHRLILFIRK